MPDGAPTPEQLAALLRLQEAETNVRRLERRVAELPEQAALAAAMEKAAAAKAEQDSRRVDLDLIDAEIRKREGELGLLQQRREHERGRLYGGGVANPRELQSMRAELNSLERRMSGLEDELLEAMERREELVRGVDELAAARRELEEEVARLRALRDEAAKGVQAELTGSRMERDAEQAALPPRLLATYEASKRRHGGVGIGALKQGICTACRLELTPLEISDLQRDAPLGTCPQCQRLLVVLD